MEQLDLEKLLKYRENLVKDLESTRRAQKMYEGDAHSYVYEVAGDFQQKYLDALDESFPQLKEANLLAI